jgi:DHA2 family multidrug resistance protein
MTDAVQGAAAGGWSPERSAAGGHNPYLIAFVVSIATFMEVLDTTIANVALRYIAGGLAVGIDESTYVITSYLVANAIVLSISGWLSTVIGRKRFYMICVAVFALASLLCGFAWNLQSLVLFRILQGLGGGGMATSEQAILADSFPPEKRGQAFAIYGIAVVVAPVIGPTLGGWISDTYSWHWVFLINVPMGLISLFLVGTLVGEPSGAEEERQRLLSKGLHVDYVGFALVAVGLGSLEFVLDEGQRNDWFGSNMIVGFAFAAAFCLVALVTWELMREDPIIDIRLLGQRQFGACFRRDRHCDHANPAAIPANPTELYRAAGGTGALAGRARHHGDDADHRLVDWICATEISDRRGSGDRRAVDVASHRNNRRYQLWLRRHVAYLSRDRSSAVVSADHDGIL